MPYITQVNKVGLHIDNDLHINWRVQLEEDRMLVTRNTIAVILEAQARGAGKGDLFSNFYKVANFVYYTDEIRDAIQEDLDYDGELLWIHLMTGGDDFWNMSAGLVRMHDDFIVRNNIKLGTDSLDGMSWTRFVFRYTPDIILNYLKYQFEPRLIEAIQYSETWGELEIKLRGLKKLCRGALENYFEEKIREIILDIKAEERRES